MNIEELVADLTKQGVKLWVESEQLRVNAPKGVLTPDTRDLLVKRKAELVSLLHQKNELVKFTGGIATNTDLSPIKVDRPQNLPLSFGQEQIWLLNQLEPDNPFYNEQAALKLHGQLNVVALEQSLNKIISRHEALRTNFDTINEQPVQVIADSLILSLPIIDLTDLPESEKAIASQQLATAETTRPFALANSPLIRASVLKLTEVEHVFLITIHHIVFDAWSMGVIMRELATIYSALCNNLSPELPELPIQYADFAIWQRQWLQAEILETQLDYWKQQLKNAPTLLELPTDRPRPAIQTFRGALHSVDLSNQLSQAVVNFTRQEGATLFMTLFAAYATLLYRYTGSDDILVGTPIAKRDRLELEGLVGFLVNTLVLRTDLSGNPSFQQLLNRVRQLTLLTYAYPDLPFEELVKALQPQRDLSHTPLFQVMFVLENAPMSEVEFAGLTVSPLTTERTIAKFDLTLFIKNTTSGLATVWQYNTDLFDAPTIERMAGHFVTLLESIITNPQEQISQLPLLTEAQQRKLLVEWNDTQTEYPRDKSIHQLFEEQVKRTPNAVAVEFGNQQLTYQQLNCRANQLAHYLKSLGVEADVLVGLCVERSLEMVLGLLGILKAGGAYVPLDPEYPTERLSFMLEDAQVSVLLTQQSLIDKLPPNQANQVCLDTDTQLISQFSQENLSADVQANNLVYIIYTSGSTGQPKGVAMNQLALCNLILWQLENMKISRGAKTLQFAPISFDVSFQEIFSTWCSGGTLLLITEELRRDAVALLGFLEEKAVERLFVPFVALQQLAEVAVDSELVTSNLREIMTAGEQLQITPAISQWLSKLNDCTLHNHYGPSESHLVTSFTLTNSVETWPLLPPIGRPIANTQIYILDKYLQAVPIGVPGELYIGGVSLARGYLNRPELTQERFIRNPFERGRGAGGGEQRGGSSPLLPAPCSPASSERLYKTGDLARYLPDGSIEYLGRIDNQVKIRGFRIELGEIEGVLSQYPHVQASCVIAREDTPGDTCTESNPTVKQAMHSVSQRSRSQRLVAYVVTHQDCTPTISELRQYLKAKLPEYMVPNAFVILKSLPLTPSGKVDRRALPAPDLYSSNSEKYVAPRTPIEELLAQIWAQVLKVEQVGVYDNFFELGGHSLLATQLVSRIRNIFKVELPLRELFAKATVAELAQAIEQLQQQILRLTSALLRTSRSVQEIELSAPPILPRANNSDLPLSYAQQRLWFLDQLEPNSALYNLPIALRLVGNVNQAALEQSLQEIIHRHEALRTNFVTVNGKSSQIIQTQTNWTLSVLEWQYLPPGEQEIATQQLIQQQAIQPFELASVALLRATLVVLSETEHILLMCMHHLVSDAWSMGVFIEELAALYNAYSQGQPSPLTPLPIQYADFALWQRNWLQGDVLQNQLSYWQQQLKDAPALLSLPTDRPRPAVQTFNGANLQFTLSVELTNRLTKLSQEQGATLFMTLLAAYDILLYRYTGVADILVGSPIANRDRSETEGLIGFFVNTLVMRSNLAGNPSFTQLLARVREMALGAYTHQDLPFEMLVEILRPERDLSHAPLFQVAFSLQNAPMQQVNFAGLTVNPLIVEGITAKFDVSLLIENTTNGLVGWWQYNTDLFDERTIKRMTGHFVTLLESIVANPQQQISQLPLLTAVEQHQLLVEWNSTQADYPQDKCIHQLFEEQVQRTPDAVAVVFGSEQLTYKQLNCRANQLAHYLRSLGVKPDVLVGICVERSLEMLIGLLGILKAGGAYLPLDPDYPTERLRFMLEDAQVSVLLTQQRVIERLPEHQANQVCLDEVWEKIDQNNQDNPTSGVKAFHLANVIYTSGSTGRPKGVMVEHKGLCNLTQAQIQTFSVDCHSRILQFASFSFDASIWEVVMALGSGATLYLGTKDSLLPGKPLIEQLRNHGITHITLPPSALAVMPSEELPTLQTIIVAGEACPAELIKQWSVGRNFFNAYGPTEASVCATICKATPKAMTSGRSETNAKCTNEDEKISIGKAIANTQIHILDEYLQPVPVGVPGELHIGGVGLARGYLNRPELTQEKFITNPFGTGRLYKTGDLARYLPDSNIEYIGRIDNQVKIRGFRIEIGEIEAALSQHGDVQICCIIAREETPGNKRLVAYVVLQKGITLTTGELRQFLSNKLPGYMIPNVFVMLESLPLTPNGKVDRRALPAPDLQQELSDYVMPNTEVESIIAGIWQKALAVEKVGIYNNFFELGGHSLLLVKINHELQEELGLELSIVDMFNYPTINSLSQYLNTKSYKGEPTKQNNYRIQSDNKIKSLRKQQLESRQQYRSQKKR